MGLGLVPCEEPFTAGALSCTWATDCCRDVVPPQARRGATRSGWRAFFFGEPGPLGGAVPVPGLDADARAAARPTSMTHP